MRVIALVCQARRRSQVNAFGIFGIISNYIVNECCRRVFGNIKVSQCAYDQRYIFGMRIPAQAFEKIGQLGGVSIFFSGELSDSP